MTISVTFTAIILVYIVILVFLGFRASKHLKNNPTFHEYAAMGGSMGAILIGFGYFTATFSASSYVGFPGNGYNIGLPFMMGVLIPTTVAPYFIVGKRLRRVGAAHKLTTLAEYVAARYDSKALHTIYALITFIFLIPYMAVQIQALGMAFNLFGGWNYNAACLLVAAVVIAYCALGGMRAAIWTDVVQGILMFAIAIIFPIVLLVQNGGFAGLLEKVQQVRPDALFPPGSPVPWASVPVLIGFVFMISLGYSGAPFSAQKFLGVKSDKAIYKGSTVSMTSVLVVNMFFQLIALLAVIALFPTLGDIKPDTLVYRMMGMYLPLAISAVMVAGIAAASMSTVSSMMVMASTSILRDLVQKVFKSQVAENKLVNYARWLIVVIGAIAFAMAMNPVPLIFTMVFFTVNIFAVTSVPIIAGLYWKRATKQGAIVSVIIGEITLYIFSAYGPLAQFHGVIGSELAIAIAVTVVLMIVVSLLTPRQSDKLLNSYFAPYTPVNTGADAATETENV